VSLRVGVVILPEHRWPAAGALWQRAEALGFDHAWTYDHLAWRTLRDSPWFGAIPTLTAAAMVTNTIRLGPLVASPNFRHPVPFAREVLTLDDISNGRLTLGIGAGGVGWDAEILGNEPWSTRERADRFAEFIALLDRLLREPATTADGTYYEAYEARSIPGCVQQPRVPFAVAGIGPRGMRLAAQHGSTWVTTGDRDSENLDAEAGARVVAEQMRRLDDICREGGREPATLDRLVLLGGELDPGLDSPDAFAATKAAYAAVGITDLVVPWPRSSEPYAGDVATFEKIFS
jgi:alkanesulfonate monooxygenase SsuD/methylene tetrahydromethanopterin reductase-like flavin-dependent oxidoreductase (luciferase family)